MKMKFFIPLIFILMSVGTSIQGYAQAMTVIRDVLRPVENLMIDDGYFLSVYDHHIAPNKMPNELLGLKNNPKSMEQKLVVKRDWGSISAGTFVHQVTFTPNGSISTITVPAQMVNGMQNDEEKVEIEYFQDGKFATLLKFSKVSTINGVENRADQTQYGYNRAGLLVKEVYNMYTPGPDNKWHKAPSFADKEDYVYTYDAEGRLLTAKVDALNGMTYYNERGLLSKIKKDGYIAYEFEYDAADGLTYALSKTHDEGPDEDEPIAIETTFTRNAQGDAVKVTKARHICNSRWLPIRKGTPKTYTIAYTYDAQGNWTKATISQAKSIIATITRTFTY